MIDVLKLVHCYYDVDAMIELNFNHSLTTIGNKFKLQKFTYHYNIRKYSFFSEVINILNSLPDYVVEADFINTYLKVNWINLGLITILFIILIRN